MCIKNRLEYGQLAKYGEAILDLLCYIFYSLYPTTSCNGCTLSALFCSLSLAQRSCHIHVDGHFSWCVYVIRCIQYILRTIFTLFSFSTKRRLNALHSCRMYNTVKINDNQNTFYNDWQKWFFECIKWELAMHANIFCHTFFSQLMKTENYC